ncbi:MAG: SAM-dependent DNA methyltransferase [Ktedonobacteraceae bacterium]|nr:SAM-dependent DNA methyltransferase [Ktedonobacteraceae bacterium]
MNNFSDKANFIWGVADLIRDTFKRGKYQDVILPFTVLRRIDCVLEPTRDAVVEAYQKYASRLSDPTQLLCSKSGYAFYNVSPFTFERLLKDAPNLAANLRSYINDFSPNMREVLEKFGFENTIKELDDARLLYAVMERFKNIDLHPDKVTNLEMGYIFEELIRKFNEALNENPGEHFTPREVIRLMVDASLTKDADIRQPAIVRKVYDPCCGSGGMLTTAKDHILEQNPTAQVYLYGQEVNKETFAVCKSDLYMKSRDGRDAEHILFGSTLADDRHEHERFHFIFANPPYGKDWKRDEETVKVEADKGPGSRFGAGLPRISDGQLLFLQNMLFHMYDAQSDRSQVAIVMNGSPLFTGDAGSGESEIRRWILENDWLEAIIALPEQLFYNTGIATYIWILTNRKSAQRRQQVQLINATGTWIAMRKSMGDKRREISQEQIEQIRDLFVRFEELETSKIFPYTTFGYRKITVERPLRLNFQVSAERLARLDEQKAFADLAVSKKKLSTEKAAEEETGRLLQKTIRAALQTIPPGLFKNREAFEQELDRAFKGPRLRPAPAVRKAILTALAERDETADICRDKEGRPEPDPDLRDSENVPLPEDGLEPQRTCVFDGYSMDLGESVIAFFEREVKPYVPDAWINPEVRDTKDGRVGKVGYEINFNRYFYKYQPPRPLEEIEADIKVLERDILKLLHEVAG